MKKIYSSLLVFLLAIALSGCGSNVSNTDDLTLKIYNWQDYIDDGTDEDGEKVSNSIMDDFEEWYYDEYNVKVTVEYDTFETNEVMLNNIKTGKTDYDLACPSEYVIQKMINYDMLEELDLDAVDPNGNEIFTNYHYLSEYLMNLFSAKGWDKYAIPYMWGTMGFLYNIENVGLENINSWNILWDTDLKFTVKDSMRDTYIVGALYVYQEELLDLSSKYENGVIGVTEYSDGVSEIINRSDSASLEMIQQALIDLKDNSFGFEVDSGKNDILTGKIDINFAWSGDAVYSMDVAEEESGEELGYVVPDEGSNIWFDGWVMPKGANVSLAESFLNYLCNPEIASRNMSFIGYTTAITGDDVWNLVNDWYSDDEGEYVVDLSYLFLGNLSPEYLTDGKALIRVSSQDRQFDTQYPSEDVIARCGIMEDFGDNNDAVIEMWQNVKIGNISIWVTFAVLILIFSFFGVFYGTKIYKKYTKKKRNKRVKAQY